MAQIVVAVASGYKSLEEQIAFLEKKANDLKASSDSYALLKTVAASSYTSLKNFEKAKHVLEEVQAMLDGALGLDPLVYSNFYRVLAIFHKNQVHAGEFYKAGLLYLAYTPVDTIALPVQKMMARDLALAGLVAEDVYGLGELLSHPVAQTLRQDPENAFP
jgi:26S proteasome regulatory subunit N9